MDALKQISQSCMKSELPEFEVGDTVKVIDRKSTRLNSSHMA